MASTASSIRRARPSSPPSTRRRNHSSRMAWRGCSYPEEAMLGNDIAVLLGFLAAAVALAGFAGIVTSIDRGAAVASNEVISFRVRNLVTSAVLSVLLSLQPVLLEALELFPSNL